MAYGSDVVVDREADVCELLQSLRRSNVDLLGESLDVTSAARRSVWVNKCTSPTADDSSQPQQPSSALPSSTSSSLLDHDKCSHLLALRRTLKVAVLTPVVAPNGINVTYITHGRISWKCGKGKCWTIKNAVAENAGVENAVFATFYTLSRTHFVALATFINLSPSGALETSFTLLGCNVYYARPQVALSAY